MKKVRDKAKMFKVIDTQNNTVLLEGSVREVAKKIGITKNNVYVSFLYPCRKRLYKILQQKTKHYQDSP